MPSRMSEILEDIINVRQHLDILGIIALELDHALFAHLFAGAIVETHGIG